MASYRLARTNDDIRFVLSNKLREVKDPRINQGMLTITHVDVTSDLRYAKVYLSVMGDFDEKQMLKGLKSCSGWLRRELGASLSLRYTPELSFILDDSITYGAHINEIISGLDIKADDEPYQE